MEWFYYFSGLDCQKVELLEFPAVQWFRLHASSIGAQVPWILQATECGPPFHPSKGKKKKKVERSSETVEND